MVTVLSTAAYLVADRLANSVNALVHDGIDMRLASPRLNGSKFV